MTTQTSPSSLKMTQTAQDMADQHSDSIDSLLHPPECKRPAYAPLHTPPSYIHVSCEYDPHAPAPTQLLEALHSVLSHTQVNELRSALLACISSRYRIDRPVLVLKSQPNLCALIKLTVNALTGAMSMFGIPEVAILKNHKTRTAIFHRPAIWLTSTPRKNPLTASLMQLAAGMEMIAERRNGEKWLVKSDATVFVEVDDMPDGDTDFIDLGGASDIYDDDYGDDDYYIDPRPRFNPWGRMAVRNTASVVNWLLELDKELGGSDEVETQYWENTHLENSEKPARMVQPFCEHWQDVEIPEHTDADDPDCEVE